MREMFFDFFRGEIKEFDLGRSGGHVDEVNAGRRNLHPAKTLYARESEAGGSSEPSEGLSALV
jgi:hypothetical protein